MYSYECNEDNHSYQYFPFFFFNDTATTEIYTLSLHDALPISVDHHRPVVDHGVAGTRRAAAPGPARTVGAGGADAVVVDRKSTRLNSSHQIISYAVFCLKKKKNNI